MGIGSVHIVSLRFIGCAKKGLRGVLLALILTLTSVTSLSPTNILPLGQAEFLRILQTKRIDLPRHEHRASLRLKIGRSFYAKGRKRGGDPMAA
jgi:hypothetical protein